jgi:hypothetical protein
MKAKRKYVGKKQTLKMTNNNNNIYYLQLGFHPVEVNKLHVYNL